MDDITGMLIRLLMYLVSFVLVLTFLALMPDVKLPITFIGRNTMGIYFFHYPIMIVLNGLLLLSIPQMLNVWVLFGVSWIFVLILGSTPVSFSYNGVLNLLTLLVFKREKQVQDEGLEEEYDEDDRYQTMLKKKKQSRNWRPLLRKSMPKKSKKKLRVIRLQIKKEEFFTEEELEEEEEIEETQEFEELQALDELLNAIEPQEEMEALMEKEEQKEQDE